MVYIVCLKKGRRMCFCALIENGVTLCPFYARIYDANHISSKENVNLYCCVKDDV